MTLTLDRRALLAALASTTALTTVGGWIKPARAQQVSTEELMKPGPLGDEGEGDPNAPVTMVEYASATCGHCAHFHTETYPGLKEKYIDTGKVYFVFREFPLDVLAAAAFMVARCLPKEGYFDFVSLLFEKQSQWAFTDKPVDALFSMAKQAGMTRADFDSCLSNQEMLDGIRWVQDRASKQFGVDSTPTFFVNGTMVKGARSLAEFEDVFKPILGS
ncbi:MAG: DsbA family protein [Rhodobiaceae bacterium]|nr:DsbA family protein [Rhodobiaceae bacterium]